MAWRAIESYPTLEMNAEVARRDLGPMIKICWLIMIIGIDQKNLEEALSGNTLVTGLAFAAEVVNIYNAQSWREMIYEYWQ